MKYINATEILPQKLIDEIQTYITGGIIYIPQHDRINRMDLIDFEDVENFNEIKKASLGNGEAPYGIRVIIQILFLYLPFLLITSLYLIAIKPMIVFAIIFIFVPVLISELISMSNNYNFEDNIKISNISSQDSIESASSKIDLDFDKLKINFDTILSREFGGQELSGDQWQRIAIARGLYRPHDFIVLDEPTAAIDPIEEANVFSTFKNLSDNKTCIFVTHRLGLTQIADKIVVMDNGKIVEKGINQELIDLKGKYYHLLRSQAKWYVR